MKMMYAAIVVAVGLSACSKDSPSGPSPSPSTNHAPTIQSATVSPLVGMKHLTIFTFAGAATDADGDTITYQWRANGVDVHTGANTEATFNNAASVVATLTATDAKGATANLAASFTIRAMDGTWRSVQTPFTGWTFTLVMTQIGGVVTGTYSDTLGASGNADATSSVDGNGAFTLRWTRSGSADFEMRGTLDASGKRATAALYNSGFNGEAVVFDRIAE